MNRLLQFCVFLLILGCAAPHAQSPNKKPAPDTVAEAEVQKASDTFYRAFYAGDVDTVKRMTRDDYLQTDVYGNVQDKTSWLAEYYRPLAERIKGGGLKLDNPKPSDFRMRLYGNVAVITGRTTLKSSVVSGQAQERDLRFTQVWVKTDGKWQRGVYHNAFVPEPSSNPSAKD
jgi:ketosteroid isomerase-like protein